MQNTLTSGQFRAQYIAADSNLDLNRFEVTSLTSGGAIAFVYLSGIKVTRSEFFNPKDFGNLTTICAHCLAALQLINENFINNTFNEKQ